MMIIWIASHNSYNFVIIIGIIKPKPIINTRARDKEIPTINFLNFLVDSSRRIENDERRKRRTNTNQAIARADEEKAATGTLMNATGKAKTNGGELRRVQVERVEAADFSDENEEAIGVGGESVAEVTVDEIGSWN